MTTNETAEVTVKMTFTTDAGEIPPDDVLRTLIADQMNGELDEETGLGCMAVEVMGRTGELSSLPYVLAVGSPFEGMRLVGPFYDVEEALHIAETEYVGIDWWTQAIDPVCGDQ